MANGKTLSPDIDTKLLTGILDDLDAFLRAGFAMRKKLSRILPAKYGSDLWWEKEEEKADTALERGDYKDFSSVDEMMRHLNAS